MNIIRILKHWFALPWQVKRCFPKPAMAAIEQAIGEGECLHLGELRFAVEVALPWRDAMDGVTARERALEVFSELRVWDTEDNNGVLIYLLLADHDVEIVADRGVHRQVGPAEWEAICREMEAHFRQHAFETGALLGIRRIHALLQQHYPAQDRDNPNQLPDAPVIM